MTITRTCNGCRQIIAHDDRLAMRDLPMPGVGATVDWCGVCVTIIRSELPRLAAEARNARRAAAAEPVRSRAMRIWSPGDSHVLPPA